MKAMDDSKINREELITLFSNIEDIYLFNANFFSQLEECGLNAVSIAKCFIKNSSGFNIYTHYCTNYPRYVLFASFCFYFHFLTDFEFLEIINLFFVQNCVLINRNDAKLRER